MFRIMQTDAEARRLYVNIVTQMGMWAHLTIVKLRIAILYIG